MKKIFILLSVTFLVVQTIAAQPKLMDKNERTTRDRKVASTTVNLKKFEKENIVEIIPKGKKVVLENFAGTEGKQTINGYSISKYEVTQALFFSVMGFNPSHFKNLNPDYFKDVEEETLPVESVTWYDAVAFCNELTKRTMSKNDCCYTITNIEKNEDGHIYSATVSRNETKKGYRLPTEAEWEMAARGGTKGGWNYEWAGSNNIDELAWYNRNSNNTTHKVGTKKPNEAGLYDMSGNVWEWCDNLPFEESSSRAYRGGSWHDYNGNCSVSYRSSKNPLGAAPGFLGFRVCRSL